MSATAQWATAYTVARRLFFKLICFCWEVGSLRAAMRMLVSWPACSWQRSRVARSSASHSQKGNWSLPAISRLRGCRPPRGP
eukprot:15472315-Alexandrium_andersonii.AAC.1